MLDNLTWKEISVCEIRPFDDKFIDLGISSDEYLFDRFRVGSKEREVFSIEAALLLTKIHPIIIWSVDNICVLGIRTMLIASSIMPTAVINVGVLPSTTTYSDVEQLIIADAWLTRLAYSTKKPATNLFQAKIKIPLELIRTLTPALEMGVIDLAKTLGVSAPTLYNLVKSKNGSNK